MHLQRKNVIYFLFIATEYSVAVSQRVKILDQGSDIIGFPVVRNVGGTLNVGC